MDDLDRLRGHPEVLHETVEDRHLLLALLGAGDDVVELHAEHDLLLRGEHPAELLGHRIQVLLLPERFAELPAHVFIDGSGESVPQQPEHGVHFLLDDLAFVFREAGEHLDHEREKRRILRGARLSEQPAPTAQKEPPDDAGGMKNRSPKK